MVRIARCFSRCQNSSDRLLSAQVNPAFPVVIVPFSEGVRGALDDAGQSGLRRQVVMETTVKARDASDGAIHGYCMYCNSDEARLSFHSLF